MSTYVMSDLHGCYDDFCKMLEKIRFSDSDRLILAGDLIERGFQNYEMLCWIGKCPENVLLLRGNHEEEFAQNIDLMSQVCRELDQDPESSFVTGKICQALLEDSLFFDYYGSIRELIRDHSVSLQALQDWAELFWTWPCQYKLRIHGRQFIIVHAGYIEDLDGLPNRKHYSNAEEFNLYARDEAYLYGGLPHATIIAGHTPTIIKSTFAYNKGNVFRHHDKVKDCIYYDIDCGAVFRYWGESDSKMACICLEDETIIYC